MSVSFFVPRLPLRAGIGFKPEHFDAILNEAEPPAFIEVHAENYMGAGGPPHAQLAKLHERSALSVHGVGLSIGGAAPLDRDHLKRLHDLCKRHEPESFSEHLAWSTHEGVYLNDLLPLPYTEETLARVVAHVEEVQEVLKRQILIENPSTYVLFSESTIAEADFMRAVAERSGCGLLLDVNNIFVSAINHGLNTFDYIEAYPLERVKQIHLAGHDETQDDAGAPLLIDAHGSPVAEPVWTLYEAVIARTGPIATLIEWDNDVPTWPVLRAEMDRANAILCDAAHRQAA
jgi:uncharacterized protein